MNYRRIAEAIDYYKAIGYTWIDTPWIVPSYITDITFSNSPEQCKLGNLVGSAEQGFIQLMLEGKLTDGFYVSAGPCFRFNDKGQYMKHPYFFKVELCAVNYECQYEMFEDALSFLKGKGVQTNEGLDIEINGIEVGSYGVRSYGNYLWTYGTGLAEPRYSEALTNFG